MSASDQLNKYFSEENFRKAFFILAGFILCVMIFSSSGYGICWDEYLMQEYGNSVLKFYTSFGKDKSYLDPNGVMHFYGPFFDLLGAIVNRNNQGDIYERRHFFIAIFGFIGILFTGLTAREISNWKVAVLAMLFVFLSPVYFGHSMFNSKDIPFAGAYMASVYFIIRFVRTYPLIHWSTVIGAIVSIGISLSIRIGGLMLVAYFGLFLVIKILRSEKRSVADLLQNKQAILKFVIAILGGYIFAVLFWPYALISPIKHPFEVLSAFSKWQFDSGNLFNGARPHYWEIPWNYIPMWIYVTTPLFICGSFFLFPIIIYKWKNFNEFINGDLFLMILFTSIFPVAYIIYQKSIIFDGWRHVTFVYPPLVVCCAAMWTGAVHVVRKITEYLKYPILALLGVFMFEPALFMAKYHKFETFYFSPAIGGVKGAFKKFDIDYYGTSLRYAVEWIAQNADSLEKGPNGKIRVRCYYGERISVEHFIKKYNNLEYVMPNEASLDWDYSIIQPVQAKHDTSLLTNWPPKGMVHQIEIDGTPIVAIGRNYNKDVQKEVSQFSIYTSNDINALINAGVKYYQVGDFFNCIAASERALMLDPGNYIALNNAASAFNNLFLFDEGIEYSKKAIELKPDFEMAKGNLNVAIDRKKQSGNLQVQGLVNNYLNLSLIYYNLHNFEMCIIKSNKVISLQPDNVAAYNNICASYNELKQYEKAIRACEKALSIDPNFELARNNLNAVKAKK